MQGGSDGRGKRGEMRNTYKTPVGKPEETPWES